MALPEKQLTAGQASFMDPLITNLVTATERVKQSQANYDQCVLALEECSKLLAEHFQIDITKDYTFDISAKKFIDRSALAVSSAEAPALP